MVQNSVKYWMGIDPGRSGGIAVISDNGDAFVHKMSETLDDLQALLAMYQENLGYCLIEKVQAYPVDLMRNRVLKLGFDRLAKQSGMIVATAALIMGNARVGEILPRVWQRRMFCLTRGDKKITLERARELYPEARVKHWNADALLIATMCKRWHGPRNSEPKDWRGV